MLLGVLGSSLQRGCIWLAFSELPNTVLYWCFLMFSAIMHTLSGTVRLW